MQPVARLHRYHSIAFSDLDHPAEVLVFRKFPAYQAIAQPPQLVAIQIADEFVCELRPGPIGRPHTVL